MRYFRHLTYEGPSEASHGGHGGRTQRKKAPTKMIRTVRRRPYEGLLVLGPATGGLLGACPPGEKAQTKMIRTVRRRSCEGPQVLGPARRRLKRK
jgi:hypothetical protein